MAGSIKVPVRYIVNGLSHLLRDNASLILLCVLLGITQMLCHGYTFAEGDNHSIHIPLLKSYFHPELYPNDPMVATRPHFTTFYLIFLATIERLFGHLQLIFFAAQLATEVLIFITIYHLAFTIFKDRNVAVIAVLLMFAAVLQMYAHKLQLGYAIIDWKYHTHTHAVLPFILWSFTLFLRGHTRKAYALLGFAANINIQSVMHVFPMFALVSLLKTREHIAEAGKRVGILSLLKDYGFFFLFSSPCLIWALKESGGPLTNAWIEQLRARSSHHSFPFSWDIEIFTEYLLFFTLGLISWTLALKNSENRDLHWTLGWFSLMVLLMCGIGTVFAEWLPVKVVLRAQLFRSTKFLTIFVLLYASYAIRHLWSKSPIHKMLAVSTFLVLFIPKYFMFMVLLVFLFQLIEARNLYWWTVPITFVVLVLRAYIPHPKFPSGIDLKGITEFVQPFFEHRLRSVLLAVFLFWVSIRKVISIRWVRQSITVAVFLLVFVYVLPATYREVSKPVSQSSERWNQLQLWAKANTPLQAVFLTPPYRSGFRIYSERSTVVEWKDGTQQYFDTEYSYEWWERINEIGKDRIQYESLSPDHLVEICDKYGASYIVFPIAKQLPFTQVYQDKDYRVYRTRI